MDWKGLLNWSLNYQDGTVNKNLKPMSQEDMKFIEDAFESVCMNEMKEIMKILDKLKIPEEETDEDIEARCDMIEDLQILIDGPENARNIVRAKRFPELLNYFFNTKARKIKIKLASLLGSILQNDKYIQNAAIDLGIFKVLELLNTSDDEVMTGKYVYLLTGILYGEYEKSKTLFLNEFDGMKLLYNLLIKTPRTSPAYRRILNIVQELTKIEDNQAENFKVRYLAMTKISEINLHLLLVKTLEELDYNSMDCIDLVKITLEILKNVIKLFDNLDEVFKAITTVNEKLNSCELLTKEEIHDEKAYIIEILKSIKLEFSKKEETEKIQLSENNICTLNSGNSCENGNVLVERDQSSGSTHIQLKK
jgi:hypothetical protein